MDQKDGSVESKRQNNQSIHQGSLAFRLYKNYDPDHSIKNRLGLHTISNEQNMFMTQQNDAVMMPKIYMKNRREQFQSHNSILPQTYNNLSQSVNQTMGNRNTLRPSNTVSNLRYEKGTILIRKQQQPQLNQMQQQKMFDQSTVLQNNQSILNESIEQSYLQKDILNDINDQTQEVKQVSSSQQNKKTKGILKKTRMRKKNSKGYQKQNQNEQVLTPDDFINLIQHDPEMQDEFCYLNKNQNSYDWQIVEFHDRNPSEYMTISSRGVTHFYNGQSEFITIEEWQNQKNIYFQLKKIEFFKDYKRWKNFQLWSKLTKRNLFRECQIVLEQNLLRLDRDLSEPLMQIQNICMNLSNTEIMDLSFTQPSKMHEFNKRQESFRVTYLEKKIENLEDTIKNMLVACCNRSLQNFKQESRIAAQEKHDEKAPMLIGDETNKEMPYTEEATIRTHYNRLRKYIRLVDYMIKYSKINLIKNGSNNILKNLKDNNESAMFKLKKEDSLRNNCWLQNEVFHELADITYYPNKEQINRLVEEIVIKSVQRICVKHKQFSNHNEFLVYKEEEDILANNGEISMDDGLNFQMAVQDDQEFHQIQKSLLEEIDVSFKYLQEYCQYLNKYLQIYDENTNIDMEQYVDMDIDVIKINLEKFSEQDIQLKGLETRSELGIFQIDTNNLKEKIKHCARQIILKLTQQLPSILMDKTVQFQDLISNENNKMNFITVETSFGFIDNYSSFVENLNSLAKRIPQYEDTKADLNQLKQLLTEFNIKLSENIKQKTDQTFKLFTQMIKKFEESNAGIDTNTNKCRQKLEKLVPELNSESKELLNDLRSSDVNNTSANIEQVIDYLINLEDKVNGKIMKCDKINHFVQILHLDEQSFEDVDELKKEFFSIQKLWKGRESLSKQQFRWYNNHFMKIDLEQVTVQSEQLYKQAGSLMKELELSDVAKLFRKDANKYKNMVEMLMTIRDEAIQEEQWEEIRDIAIKASGKASALSDKNDVINTFAYLGELNLLDHKEELVEIQLKSVKGAELVKMLNQVETFWRSANLQFLQYKDHKDQHILGDIEELVARIDDSLLTLNNIMASRFVEAIRSKVEVQVKMFRYLQELLDEWLLHQRNWIYLEPVLTGGGNLGLAKEAKQFNTASQKWKKIMKRAKENSNVKGWAEEYQNQKTLKEFQGNNAVFDQIQKALEDFLEKKREQFGRFFFLSNESLLEILSTVKNPIDMLQHLLKVFDGIETLELEDEKGELAKAMVSPEKEKVEFVNCHFRGEVEDWMKTLESQMKLSLQKSMRRSMLSYENDVIERNQWVLNFPSQIILTADSVFWCRITEDQYLSVDAEEPLSTWYQVNVMQLDELGNLIRSDRMTSAQRKSIVALITQDVHYRDIIEILINEEVTSMWEFKWQQQLRFYYEEENITSKQVNSQLDYGYEYYGATTRLVITALTDKCWMTITGALHIKLGSNPQGPAGTGKTESCKDLAKSLGRYCLVYNCSDQVNVKMTAKLLAGLAYTGSWTCLDEFNRIDIEVLSVIAQQVLQIREALLADKQQFLFFGKQCQLSNQVGIFVTMNPGYAGRTELPDNLKVLFRPVSMMVPNYAQIAEIMLFAEGFSDAKELSRKMHKLYQLSSQQLSQQKHYDFGMRAVKSVLVMAGNLKRINPDTNEDILLIKAMCDSNIPKFLDNDLPLFNAIVGDLFQGVQINDNPNEELKEVIIEQSQKHNLGSLDNFSKKVLQFHETINVRFGVMLIGGSFTGKTTIKNILLESYNALNTKYSELDTKDEEREKGLEKWAKVEEKTINPKSINIVELFGEFQELTQTWIDGLASYTMREAVANQTGTRQFMTFDGPVDSLWIENLNTVLDDSQTLCLGNGERIKLKPSMKIFFEVVDLQSASPATVSRLGMVYVSDETIDTSDFIHQQCQKKLLKLFSTQRRKKENQWYCFNWLIQSVIDYVLIFTSDERCHKFIEGKIELDPKKLQIVIHMNVILAFCWAFGANLGEYSNINDFERKIVNECFDLNLLPKGNIYGSYIDYSGPIPVYAQFENDIPEFQCHQNQSFFDMIVPTQEIICYSFLLMKAIPNQIQFFLTGIPGSGKTIVLQNIIQQMDQTQMASYLDIKFSAQTSSYTIQQMIEQKLQLQRKNKKQILMPPPGKKLLIVVDDVNMPMAEESGAQPPIELLRQILDSSGVYDRKQLNFKEIQESLIFIGGGLPGGGRKNPTPRFLSKFNQINLKENHEDSLVRIFSSILGQHLKSQNMRPEVMDIGVHDMTVIGCLNLFKEMQENLKPTPKKPQYLFSLKDVAKVFQGLLMTTKDNCKNKDSFIRIWIHEAFRIFGDRLMDKEEYDFFYDLMNKQLLLAFKYENKVEDLVNGSESNPNRMLIYADYFQESKVYEECIDLNRAIKQIDIFKSEINMNLVLFREAVNHISRLSRILRMERGHALLIGLGGSGKQSISKLTGYIANQKVMGVEGRKNYGNKEFREDLYKVMSKAAFDNQKVMFLFGDQNAISESFYEDINNLIGSGEVPACINKDELEAITTTLQDEASKVNTDPLTFFYKRVRQNVHVVLTMSPIGDGLRNRLNMFPAIASQCYIDWVAEWPQDALRKVADLFLSDENMGEQQLNLSNENRSKLCDFSVFVHSNIIQQTEVFYQQLKRRVYVTPKTYLNYIEAFQSLLVEKKGMIQTQRDKLAGGLTKLASANDTIQGLQQKITELQPILDQKAIEMDKLLVKLEKDRVEANKVKSVVEEEERLVNIKASKIQDAKNDADAILKKAMPTLNAAMEALNTLNRTDIAEIKQNNKPHPLVLFTLESVNILLGEKADWQSIKSVLADPSFLSRLQNYDVHNIPLKIEKNIKSKLAENPDYQPKEVKVVNVAAKSMCEWILGVSSFTDINREINKKKAIVVQMDKELIEANKILSEKQSQLKEVIDKVNELEKQFQDSKKEQDRLSSEKKLCTDRLERASQLTEALADESVRWKENVKVQEADLEVIVGNISIGAAVVGYLGPFTGLFRDSIIDGWIKKVQELEMNLSDGYDLKKVLGDTFEIRDWNGMGLPSDSISVVNGLLVKYASQYPLLIDPQLQGSKWLKNLNKKNGLQVMSMNNENMLKTVEMCIRMGQPVILEDVKDTLDSSLEPLLTKDYIIQGNRKLVKIGENNIDLDPKFKMFFTTKLSNPSFLPEVFIRVTIINFTVTSEGLQEQFLADVVMREMPEVEVTRQELVLSIAKNKLQLQQNEDLILDLLANSKGNILDDVQLLSSLQKSKQTSELIKESLQVTEEKQVEINQARSSYEGVALRSTIIYFVVADLANIDSMYQFSLNYFSKLFNGVIENCQFQGERMERVQILINQITEVIFQNVCRGLMNNHKQIFGFLTATQIQIKENQSISNVEWSVFLRGIPLKAQTQKKNTKEQKSEQKSSESPTKRKTTQIDIQKQYEIQQIVYDSLNYLSTDNQIWQEIHQSLKKMSKNWIDWISSETPYSDNLPFDFEQNVSKFQKLLLIKIMKVEKTLKGMNWYIEKQQGKQYVSGLITTLEQVYKDIDKQTCLIFILSPGADPMNNLIKLSRDMKIEPEKLHLISLGQGQEVVAENAIINGSQNGGWVVLQNCHLSKSFMPQLEKILEKQNNPQEVDSINGEFRLFLTSNPCSYFPISILQNGMKLTNEPPKGIKANITKTYGDFNQDKLDEISEASNKRDAWKKILFSLSLFHAIVQERRKFGSLGFNNVYEFNESDLETSLTIARNLLESQEEIPWEAIGYVTGEINYGGRITDSFDNICLTSILSYFLQTDILKDDYMFTQSKDYISIKVGDIHIYKEYISQLPDYDDTTAFGMHSNANIALQMNDSKNAIETILSIQPKDVQVSSKQSPEEMIYQTCEQFKDKVPIPLKKTVNEDQKLEQDDKIIDSLQICMQQECQKFNRLILAMIDSLTNLQKAIKGESAMNQSLDQMYHSLINNQVPQIWHKVAYPSLKPLGSWFNDFLDKINFFRNWLENDKPKTYSLSAFYFPQGFLTSVLQNFARKYRIPVDQLDFQFQFTGAYTESELSSSQMNPDFANIVGLYIEGARFNLQKMMLDDSLPGEIQVKSPIIIFIPQNKQTAKQDKIKHEIYHMPIYKTSLRRGTLDTTGLSTNYIITVACPTTETPQNWILNGAAFLCQLDD